MTTNIEIGPPEAEQPHIIDAEVLSDEEIRRIAPSVFADHPHERVSTKYSFVPTSEIVKLLRAAGWHPVKAKQQRVRDHTRFGFQKHMLRFRNTATPAVLGEFHPEIVLTNSSDRSSRLIMHAGIFVLVCSNGLVVANATFGEFSIIHKGFDPDEVLGATNRLASDVPKLLERVDVFSRKQLTEGQQIAFANAALQLRYPDITKAPVTGDRLLASRGFGNDGDDLWHTLNRVQRNLIVGGQRDYDRRTASGRRAGAMRSIKGLDKDLELNKGVWSLAEKVANDEPLVLAE